MQYTPRLLLLPLTLLVSCAPVEGPSRLHPPVATSASSPPTSCDRAQDLRGGARDALVAGRLLRARRWLDRADALCPTQDGEVDAIRQDLSIALGEVGGSGRAPSEGDELRDVPASTDEARDYRRAARDYLAGRVADAGVLAWSVALARGSSSVEALVLAAKAAERSGLPARAARMYARAHVSACRQACGLSARPPEDERELILPYPGRRVGNGCSEAAIGAGGRSFSADGAFELRGVDDRVAIRSTLDRILVDWWAHPEGVVHPRGPAQRPDFVCLSDAARWGLVHYAPDREYRVEVGNGKSPVRLVSVPSPTGPGPSAGTSFLTTRGEVYMGWAMDLDQRMRWFRVEAGSRTPKASGIGYPILLPDGTIVGTPVGRPRSAESALARFEAPSGRVLNDLPVLGPRWVIGISADGRRLYAREPYKPLNVVDTSSGAVRTVPWPDDGVPIGAAGASGVLMRNKLDESLWLMDVEAGTTRPAGLTVSPLTARLNAGGTHLVVARTDGAMVVEIASGKTVLHREVERLESADLSADGRWLALGGEGEVALVDRHQPGAIVYRKPLAHARVDFRRSSEVLRVGRPIGGADTRGGPTEWVTAYDLGGRVEVPVPEVRPRAVAKTLQCPPSSPEEKRQPPRAVTWSVNDERAYVCGWDLLREGAGEHGIRLGDMRPFGQLTFISDWDERSGLLVMMEVLKNEGGKPKFRLVLARSVEGRLRWLKLMLALGSAGGMAIDDNGYYEFFGDVSPAFRSATSCGDDLPIDVCADRWEAPGMLHRFIGGDFAYGD